MGQTSDKTKLPYGADAAPTSTASWEDLKSAPSLHVRTGDDGSGGGGGGLKAALSLSQRDDRDQIKSESTTAKPPFGGSASFTATAAFPPQPSAPSGTPSWFNVAAPLAAQTASFSTAAFTAAASTPAAAAASSTAPLFAPSQPAPFGPFVSATPTAAPTPRPTGPWFTAGDAARAAAVFGSTPATTAAPRPPATENGGTPIFVFTRETTGWGGQQPPPQTAFPTFQTAAAPAPAAQQPVFTCEQTSEVGPIAHLYPIPSNDLPLLVPH